MSEPTVERFTVFGREGTNCIAVADGHWVRFSDYDTLTEERDRLERDRDFWKEQFQVETRYRIELADKGTLQALTDANIRMEKAEAERDRLAKANAELKPLLQNIGDGIVNMFDQLVMGNWRDDHDHDVKMNVHMLNLQDVLKQIMRFRADYLDYSEPDFTKHKATSTEQEGE